MCVCVPIHTYSHTWHGWDGHTYVMFHAHICSLKIEYAGASKQVLRTLILKWLIVPTNVTFCLGLSVCIKNSANALCIYVFLNLHVGTGDIRSASTTRVVARF
jgi:hypothetical protein